MRDSTAYTTGMRPIDHAYLDNFIDYKFSCIVNHLSRSYYLYKQN